MIDWKFFKGKYWFISLVLIVIIVGLMIVFVYLLGKENAGTISPVKPPANLTSPSTVPAEEPKLIPSVGFNCPSMPPAEEKTGTGKGWAKMFNMKLVCESACSGESQILLPFPVQQTSDGSFVTVGTMFNLTHTAPGPITAQNGLIRGPPHVYLLKADADGNLWNKTYGNGLGNAVEQTSDNGYIIAVYEESGSYLMKTDANGNMLWTKSFEICNGEYAENPHSIFQTSDGGYVVAGESLNCKLGNPNRTLDLPDGFLLKVDANGNKIWGKAFGGGKSDRLLSAYQTSDGGYIAFGSSKSFSNGSIFPEWTNVSLPPTEFYLVKTDADGNMILNKTFGEYDSDVGYVIRQTSNRGYVITRSGYAFQLDENGNKLWNKTFELVHYPCPESYGLIESPFWQTSDGGFVAVASGGAEEQNRKSIKLVKFDESGNLEWYKNIFVWSENILTLQTSSVQQTSDGGYIIGVGGDPGGGSVCVSGFCYWPITPVNYYLAKTDENGNV